MQRLRSRLGAALHRAGIAVERWWDSRRLARRADRAPQHFRIQTYLGHGTRSRAVVRGRVLDNPPPPPAIAGETVWAAIRRTIARFSTDELPDVPLRVTVGSVEVGVRTDAEGYFKAIVDGGLGEPSHGWLVGSVSLDGLYRGLDGSDVAQVRVRVPERNASFGVISDVDDTILDTGAQRLATMVRNTLVGSELTRTPLEGASELYRALEAGASGNAHNPFFYVSSSPWNLHGFLLRFLEHRQFPIGPILLRDLLGVGGNHSHSSHKQARIAEVLEMHPGLPFLLIGDSGQHDPEIYAEVVSRHPDRIAAVYIREVRLDPGDGRVERVSGSWSHAVPFVLAADSAAIADHAAEMGLLPPR